MHLSCVHNCDSLAFKPPFVAKRQIDPLSDQHRGSVRRAGLVFRDADDDRFGDRVKFVHAHRRPLAGDPPDVD